MYVFKPGPEAIWFILTAVATVLLQAIVTQPAPPTDVKVWLVAVGAACVRAILGAVLQLIGNPQT